MSYDISRTSVITLEASMATVDVRRLYFELKRDLPESCFLRKLAKSLPLGPDTEFGPKFKAAVEALRRHDPKAAAALEAEAEEPRVSLTDFAWHGMGSAQSMDLLREKIAPHIKGLVEVAFVWEGGDSLSGLRIQDGVATEMDVRFQLVPASRRHR